MSFSPLKSKIPIRFCECDTRLGYQIHPAFAMRDIFSVMCPTKQTSLDLPGTINIVKALRGVDMEPQMIREMARRSNEKAPVAQEIP